MVVFVRNKDSETAITLFFEVDPILCTCFRIDDDDGAGLSNPAFIASVLVHDLFALTEYKTNVQISNKLSLYEILWAFFIIMGCSTVMKFIRSELYRVIQEIISAGCRSQAVAALQIPNRRYGGHFTKRIHMLLIIAIPHISGSTGARSSNLLRRLDCKTGYQDNVPTMAVGLHWYRPNSYAESPYVVNMDVRLK